MSSLRFIPKFSNGYWKLFDTVRYEETDIYPSQKTAIAMSVLANTLVR